MQPLFSIVIPTYNRALLIQRSIESVLKQTFSDWELIIIDDGSTDNTKAVIAKYTDTRIKYIYQQNAERSAARNKGITLAAGIYICFLDSDDYYFQTRLELLYNQLHKRNFPVAFFYTGIAFEENDEIVNRPEQPDIFNNTGDFLSEAVIGTPQVCIHRDILLHHRFDTRFYMGEDLELWLRITEQYPIVYLDDQYTVVATVHPERSVNVARYNSFSDRLIMLRYIYSQPHPGSKISRYMKKRWIAQSFFGIAKYYIYNGRRFKAIIPMVRSIIDDMQATQLKFRINVLVKLLMLSPMSQVKELINY